MNNTDLIIPKHIAIIMDGNGRWAKAKGKLRTFGHKQGVATAKEIVRVCGEYGVKSLTLFAFSSENWQRPDSEVGFIMRLFVEALQLQVKELNANNVRLRFIGDRTQLSENLQQGMAKAESLMQNNDGLTLNVAVSYGGKWDIINSVKQALLESEEEDLTAKLEALDELTVSGHTQTSDQEDVDLLIRTGGEKRISNFLLWQSAYAEFVFTDTLWPDFSPEKLTAAIEEFSTRQRRFGLTGEQVTGEPVQ